MPRIRRFRPGDEPALATVCLLTAAEGADATGQLDDDELWAQIFVLPYVAHDPELTFVVETDDGRVAGYVVATADTVAFEAWFAESWWPRLAGRWPRPLAVMTAQDGLLRYAYARGEHPSPYGGTYPAHLHIDLLPELQRQGWGSRLVETLVAQLREAGVSGLHLAAHEANAGALAFYERLGFTRLASEPGVVAFGMELQDRR
jgi:ribosomal protein S18 acetylase RimI-like enzyme